MSRNSYKEVGLDKFWQRFRGILMLFCTCVVNLQCICYHLTQHSLIIIAIVIYSSHWLWNLADVQASIDRFFFFICLKGKHNGAVNFDSWLTRVLIQCTKTQTKQEEGIRYSILSPAASQKAKMQFMCILKANSLLVLIKKSCHIPKRMCQLERSQPSIENKWGR